MALESPQPFQKSSLGSTIVPLTLREKVLCAGVIAMPKGHILTRLLNLRGRWLASATTASIYSPSYHARKSEGSFPMMYTRLIKKLAKTSYWLKEMETLCLISLASERPERGRMVKNPIKLP